MECILYNIIYIGVLFSRKEEIKYAIGKKTESEVVTLNKVSQTQGVCIEDKYCIFSVICRTRVLYTPQLHAHHENRERGGIIWKEEIPKQVKTEGGKGKT